MHKEGGTRDVSLGGGRYWLTSGGIKGSSRLYWLKCYYCGLAALCRPPGERFLMALAGSLKPPPVENLSTSRTPP